MCTNSEGSLENTDAYQYLFNNDKEAFNNTFEALCHSEVAFNFQKDML